MAAWFPGAAPPLEGAASQMREIKTREKALAKELRSLQQQARRANQREGDAAAQPSAALSVILLLLFVFTGYDPELSVEFWERQRETQGLPKLSRAVHMLHLENLFYRQHVQLLLRVFFVTAYALRAVNPQGVDAWHLAAFGVLGGAATGRRSRGFAKTISIQKCTALC